MSEKLMLIARSEGRVRVPLIRKGSAIKIDDTCFMVLDDGTDWRVFTIGQLADPKAIDDINKRRRNCLIFAKGAVEIREHYEEVVVESDADR